MATTTWNSAVSADWDTGADWSPAPPTADSTVAIAVPGSYDVTIAGTETVSVDSFTLSAAELSVFGPLTLDDYGAMSVIGPDATLQLGNRTGDGWTVYDDGSLSNAGTLSLAGSYYAPIWASVFSNTGVVLAENAAEIALVAQTLTNIGSGMLTGGTYDAIGANSQIDLQSSTEAATTIVVDNADITLSGFGSELNGYVYDSASQSYDLVGLEASLATIAANGVLNVLGGRGYDAVPALTDDGLLTLGGGVLSAPGLTLGSNATLAGFGTVVPRVSGDGSIIAQGGTLILSAGVSGPINVQVDAGATLVISGTVSAASVNNGIIIAGDGSLDLAGAVSGTGSLVVAQGSVGAITTLELSGASSNTISFGGDFALLRLDQPTSFSGAIADLGAGDTIDLAGVIANAATLAGSVLDLTNDGTIVDALPVTGVAPGLSYTTLSDGGGGTDIVATGSGLKFNFTYDPSVASAPAGFEQAMTIAADVLGSLITNSVTLNIDVGWGEVGGDSSGFAANGGDADGEGGANILVSLPYSQFKADYIANASNAEQRTAAANLPQTDPTNGQGVNISISEAEAWGLLPANTTLTAGSVGFDTSMNWNYGTVYNPSYGDSLVNVALHELTHAMGRAGNFLDLFRYTAPGVQVSSNTAAGYFSIDNGTTDLANFDTSGGDPFDWAATYDDSLSVGNDTFIPSFSSVDNTVMNALGFDDNANFVGQISASANSAGQTVSAGGVIAPFSGVVISDPVLYDMETLTITIAEGNTVTDALGTLTYSGGSGNGGSGITLTETGTGSYSFSAASASAITAALNNLDFTASNLSSGATAVFTLVDSNYNAASSTTVTDVSIVPVGTTQATTGTIATTGTMATNSSGGATSTTSVTGTTSNSGSISTPGTISSTATISTIGTIATTGTISTTGTTSITGPISTPGTISTAGTTSTAGPISTTGTISTAGTTSTTGTISTTGTTTTTQPTIGTSATTGTIGITPTLASAGGEIFNTAAQADYTTGTAATTITGGTGSVTVTAGSGGGLFVGGSGGDNVLTAMSGNTTMFGGGNADTLMAGASAGNGTVLVAGPGDETLDASGCTGNVALFGNAAGGNTTIAAGTGSDTIGTAGASSTVTGAAGGTGLIFLGATNNTVVTNASATLVGAGTNDTISAGVGAMLDYAGASNTEFVGGSAASTLVGGTGNTTMFGGAGGGVIFGGSGSNIVVGGAGSLTMVGGAGSTLLYGGSNGGNQLYAGSGNVTLVGGGNGDVLSVGNSGSNLLVAGAGAESLMATGATGTVVAFGGSGYDAVGLGSGANFFAAGTGSASVTAGSGVDEFIFFNGSAGSTTISGFNASQDYVALEGYGSGAAATAIATQSIAGGNTTLNLADGTRITLTGVSGISSSVFV